MSNDLTFFTNEPDSTLLDRFIKTLKDVRYFDILVGYFRTSGFHKLYKSFEEIEKIRILIGLNLDNQAYEIIDSSRNGDLDFESHKRTKDIYSSQVKIEVENSEDNYDTEISINKFREFLLSDCINPEQDKINGGNGKKLEIRVFPSKDIHAKVYISRFKEGDRDFGRIITGSSNFSEAGLIANREFNVELKNRMDVEFALIKFNELWKDSVEVSNNFVDTIRKHTWLNDTISPYELYLKFLYEYFKEDINLDEYFQTFLPHGFLELQYQKQAVLSAKKMLDSYNGVFLADVVGLGKTFISALLAQQLTGKILVICPPVLKEYWYETFFDFGVRGFKIESLGKLENIIREGFDKFDYIFIDEAHRFRNEVTIGYEYLHQICFGKKIILVSATPLNNKFDDIYSQIKLFQIPKNSNIPGVQNLEKYFSALRQRLKEIDKSDPEYIETLKELSKDLREKILKYVMVRRTRKEIQTYFNDDIVKQGLFFPSIDKPNRIVYTFDSKTEKIFYDTLELLKQFKYTRYTPKLFLKEEVSEFEKQGQRNLGGFMKGILVKRLESSFHAFGMTLKRFIESYEKFIKMFNNGTVYISKKINVYDYIEDDDEESLLKFIEEDKVEIFKSNKFIDEYISLLKKDLKILNNIKALWDNIKDDLKLNAFINEIEIKKILKNSKFILFTESKETGRYLYDKLCIKYPGKVMFYYSGGGFYNNAYQNNNESRITIKNNFDPSSSNKKDDIKILISTDILAEGINLHRSNIVINYDLPWNPTKVLQRVGRVNRIGTEHKMIHIFNFFPTTHSDEHLGLENNIKAKIQAFHDTLGEDSKYLTEEEQVSSHELFGDWLYKKLSDSKTYEGESEDERFELEYLQLLRNIRDNNPIFFEKIKRLPKKARTAKNFENISNNSLITFFRKDKLKKFFISNDAESKELNFFDAVDLMKCDENEIRENIPKSYYELLDKNKNKFDSLTEDEQTEKYSSHGRSNEQYVISRLKTKEISLFKGYTEEDEEYIKSVSKALQEGIIPRNTSKRLKELMERETNPIKILGILKMNIPYNILNKNYSVENNFTSTKEIILSEFLKKS